ncbi:MAG: hypothetical protein ACE5GE_05065 [Phycisphaerae bacterium]
MIWGTDMKRAGRWLIAVSLLSLSGGWSGCNTTGAGGGGGGGGSADTGGTGGQDQDPLPDFQLGAGNDSLDADVAAITAADNQALACANQDLVFTEQDVLSALKQGYVADDTLEMDFPEFVADLVDPEQAKANEICDTTLDNASEELLTWIQRLTDSRNEGATCLGEPATLTNENSLLLLKTEYLTKSVRLYSTLLSFAEVFVPDVEQTVAGLTCTGQ